MTCHREHAESPTNARSYEDRSTQERRATAEELIPMVGAVPLVCLLRQAMPSEHQEVHVHHEQQSLRSVLQQVDDLIHDDDWE
jgi:hypothetical protein